MQHLLEHCRSQLQEDAIEAYIKHGTNAKAAAALGLSTDTLKKRIRAARLNAAKAGVAPEAGLTNQTAAGFATKRVSTLYKGDGSIGAQWHIQEQDKAQQLEALAAALDNYEWKPAPRIEHTGEEDADLLTLYTLTDYHLGMYAYAKESGEAWDHNIAAELAVAAVDKMMKGSPDSALGILNIQGDFMHWDGLDAVTPASKHILDASTRFAHLVDLSLDFIMGAVELLAEKHKAVRVIVCEGNHDMASSLWIRKAIGRIFMKNERITVDDTDFPFYAYLHGDIMIGFHHGHKVKNKSLPALFASEPRYRSMWGTATYTYIHTGHYHHAEQDMSEGGGAIVERHPTLSSRDAYSARGGYTSWRAAHAITYHNITGECLRVTVTPNVS
jgi:hypothetical protein